MNDPPRFSVVTPSYNQGAYIERTIDSVLSQGYPNLEYIIIDGGSSDQSVEVIRRYEKYLAYWVSEPDRGQSNALNKGFERATGDVLAWLNSDDWYEPGAVPHMVDVLEQNRDAGMVVGAGRIVDEAGGELYYKEPGVEISLETLYRWLQGGDFMQPSTAWRRWAYTAAGLLDETVHIALDVDLWLRMARAGVRFVTTPKLLSSALRHPAAKTTAYEEIMRMDCAIVIIRHGGEREVRTRLEQMAARLAWYDANYEAVVGHPVMRLLRPLVKRLAKPGGYWAEAVPPWVKG